MKKFLLIYFIFSSTSLFARHIAGGEIFYEYIGPGQSANTSIYRITLRLFRDCQSTGAQLDPRIYIAIFDKLSSSSVSGSPFEATLDHIDVIQKNTNIPCIINPPVVCYQVGFYYLTVTLPDNQWGYWVSFQRCCRVDNISNLSIPVGTGATYLGSIAGTNTLGNSHNSSPQFLVKDTALVCHNRQFVLDFGARDPDGDSLTYEFCEAYDGGSNNQPVVNNPAPPPYNTVPYGSGFSASLPLGSQVTINANNGIISGLAPSTGSFVIAVCVTEWRNNKPINTHRKDFILKIADCDFAAATLPLTATYCDDFSALLENQTPSSLIYSWYWDFGVPGTDSDTSNQQKPIYTYADTGIYTVKLVVNRGDPCTDSTTMQLGVFPGFFPNFNSSGVCLNKPTQFNDATSTVYGTVNRWQWDFGESSANNDSSSKQNPVYTYSTAGVKTILLMAKSSKGCMDTVTKTITIIDKPPIGMPFRDTLICSVDSLMIPVTGNGIFSWQPGYNIVSANTSTALVYPKTTTWYQVQLDDNGCINYDSVRVRVVDFVTLTARSDSTFCKGDGIELGATTDGLKFSWAPNINLSNPNILNPIANPPVSTTYRLTASIGKCAATDDVTVYVVPYPFVNAGNDQKICYNGSVRLQGTVIASSFFWKPQGSLDNPNTLTPLAYPPATTSYILTGYDTLGCPKPGFDTVIVTVLPKVMAFAGNDTSIIAGQPLQLNASGGENYSWSPPTGLNNINIASPVARLTGEQDSIRYRVLVRNILGCTDSAFVTVKIFRTDPQIFVPTGFTPNGDGLNDFLRPIGVGIQRIEYFRVYNRWGQLVFSTTQNGHGWDGKIGGKPQTTNTFAWVAKAVDYTGKSVFAKGTATLIR
jgi:gliding motility-associated-like protein